MEAEYITLLQRDQENLEEGDASAVKIIKMANKGDPPELIAEKLHIDLSYVNQVLEDLEVS